MRTESRETTALTCDKETTRAAFRGWRLAMFCRSRDRRSRAWSEYLSRTSWSVGEYVQPCVCARVSAGLYQKARWGTSFLEVLGSQVELRELVGVGQLRKLVRHGVGQAEVRSSLDVATRLSWCHEVGCGCRGRAKLRVGVDGFPGPERSRGRC